MAPRVMKTLPGKGSTVLILGLGQYPKGSGISAALFFAKRGADVIVTDLKTSRDLGGNVERLERFKNVRFTLGKHDLKDIEDAELIVANPRVRPDAAELRFARRQGIPVTSDIALFLSQCPATVVAVTGTRGKSTTSSLVAAILKAGKRNVWLGGNILVSPLTFLHRVKNTDIVVLELSSWQCESLQAGHAPHIAVVTNLMRDHLNTYSGMEDYAQAKAQIFRHQLPEDLVVLNRDDAYGKRWIKEAPGRVRTFGKEKGNDATYSGTTVRFGALHVAAKELLLIGEHNLANAAAAVLAAQAAGAKPSAIKKGLRTFAPLPNRLETIRVLRGVRYVNDTCATTPDGTLAAYRALEPLSRNLHFILGGADKELEYAELGRVFKKEKRRVRVYLLPGDASKKLGKVLRGMDVLECVTLADAVTEASKAAHDGDSVVLSPGAASFNQFRNEFERGEMFEQFVKRL